MWVCYGLILFDFLFLLLLGHHPRLLRGVIYAQLGMTYHAFSWSHAVFIEYDDVNRIVQSILKATPNRVIKNRRIA